MPARRRRWSRRWRVRRPRWRARRPRRRRPGRVVLAAASRGALEASCRGPMRGELAVDLGGGGRAEVGGGPGDALARQAGTASASTWAHMRGRPWSRLRRRPSAAGDVGGQAQGGAELVGARRDQGAAVPPMASWQSRASRVSAQVAGPVSPLARLTSHLWRAWRSCCVRPCWTSSASSASSAAIRVQVLDPGGPRSVRLVLVHSSTRHLFWVVGRLCGSGCLALCISAFLPLFFFFFFLSWWSGPPAISSAVVTSASVSHASRNHRLPRPSATVDGFVACGDSGPGTAEPPDTVGAELDVLVVFTSVYASSWAEHPH